ncbi:hypothetical protein [Microcoleus sp. D2_18a_D3]|uniref:hypothetical protein n=1 Tax=Microcoleus sp. D2_18a_D3 TaxID=3055330 RepID=UPI002FD3B7D6
MDNSVRPNLRYCIIIIKVKAIASGRRKFGNGFCNGCNGCQEEGRREKEEGRRKKEEGRCNNRKGFTD